VVDGKAEEPIVNELLKKIHRSTHREGAAEKNSSPDVVEDLTLYHVKEYVKARYCLEIGSRICLFI
jgi:hypothetical protein